VRITFCIVHAHFSINTNVLSWSKKVKRNLAMLAKIYNKNKSCVKLMKKKEIYVSFAVESGTTGG
jgi:hypothetical protein